MRALLFIKYVSIAQLVEQYLHTVWGSDSSSLTDTIHVTLLRSIEELPSLRAHNTQRFIVSSNNWLVRWNLTPEMSVQVWPR